MALSRRLKRTGRAAMGSFLQRQWQPMWCVEKSFQNSWSTAKGRRVGEAVEGQSR